MKLSDLRECDICHGPVGICFRILKASLVVIDARQAQQEIGGIMQLGGHVALAEAIGSAGGDVVKIAAEHEGGEWEEIFVCLECWVAPKIDFAEAFFRRAEAKLEAEKSDAADGD